MRVVLEEEEGEGKRKKEGSYCYSNALEFQRIYNEADIAIGILCIPGKMEYVVHAWLEDQGEIIDPTCPEDESLLYEKGYVITSADLDFVLKKMVESDREAFFRDKHPRSAGLKDAEAKAIEAGYRLEVDSADAT